MVDSILDLNANSNNLSILIVERYKSDTSYRTAEEILLRIIFNKLKLEYKILEYINSSQNLNETYINITGSLPVLYYKGSLIQKNKIPFFLKFLVLNEDFSLKQKDLFEKIILNGRDLLYPLTKKLYDKSIEIKNVKVINRNDSLIDYLLLHNSVSLIINQVKLNQNKTNIEDEILLLVNTINYYFRILIDIYKSGELHIFNEFVLYSYMKENFIRTKYSYNNFLNHHYSNELNVSIMKEVNHVLDSIHVKISNSNSSSIDLHNDVDIISMKLNKEISSSDIKSYEVILNNKKNSVEKSTPIAIKQENVIWNNFITIMLFTSFSLGIFLYSFYSEKKKSKKYKLL